MSTNHNPLQLILLFVNLTAIIATTLVIITALGFQFDYEPVIPEILRQGVSEVDNTFPTPISPRGWLNAGWLLVIAWQLAWAVYGIMNIWRTFAGVPVYVSPELQTVPLLMSSTMAYGMTVAWFIVYDREYVTTSVLFSFSVTGLAWIAFIFSVYTLHISIFRLKKGERFKDIWLHRLLVQNGLAVFGSWTYLVTAFNLATTLIYNDNIQMDEELASVVSLSVLGAQMTIYLLLDVIALDRWTRYVFTPYLVNIVALCACMIRSEPWKTDDVIFIVLASLLVFAFLSIMIKSACVACRVMKQSSNGSGEIPGDSTKPTYKTESHYLLHQ